MSEKNEKKQKNKKSKKGGSKIGILLLILLLLGGAGVGIGVGTGGGLNLPFAGGQGPETTQQNSTAPAETPAETDRTEEEPPVSEKIEYLSVTVSGNEYLFQNSRITLDELITKLTDDARDLPVMITDDNASQKAYRELTEALKEHNISYIESNE